MSGLETTHRIVEKIEVADADKAINAFDKLSGVAGMAAKALGLTSKKVEEGQDKAREAAEKASEALEQAGDAGQNGGKKTKKSWWEAAAAMVGIHAAGELVADGIKMIVGGLKDMLMHGLEVNDMYAEMEDNFAGLIFTLTDFGKVKDPLEQFAMSQRGATALIAEFERTAIKVAEPLEKIQSLGQQIQPVWTSLGKTQLDIAKVTESTAAAAKVMGVSSEELFSKAQRILMTGKAQKKDAIAQILFSKADIKAKDTALQKANKLEAALKKIGEPVGAIAAGTDDAIQRWKTLTDGILRGATKPIYDKIGQVVQSIVDFTMKHSDAVDKVVDTLQSATEVVWDIAKGVGETLWAFWDVTGALDRVSAALDTAYDLAKSFWRVVELVGHAWKVVSESIKVLSDPNAGMAKLNVLVDGLYLKLMKVVQAFADVMGSLAKMVLPDFIQDRLPDQVKGWFDEIKGTYKAFDNYVAGKERDVAKREEALGMAPSTELGRTAGQSKEEQQKFLAGLKGQNRPIFLQKIEKLEIKQDFRDQDPDRVMVEFTRDLEALGERALQSTVGGAATTFGPGASY